MASSMVEETVPSENVLEWVEKDKRRFLHAVYRVGDLDRTIKCVSIRLLCKYCTQSMFCSVISFSPVELFLFSLDFILNALG